MKCRLELKSSLPETVYAFYIDLLQGLKKEKGKQTNKKASPTHTDTEGPQDFLYCDKIT